MSTKLERLLGIVDVINRGSYPSVQDLCEAFEVKPRTLHEDIRTIRDRLRLDIGFDRARSGYFNKDPQKSLPLFELSEGELLFLTLGKEMLQNYAGTSFEPLLQTAISKIQARLPESISVELDALTSAVRFRSGSVVPISCKLFLDLNASCRQKLTTHITYYTASRGEWTERDVDPYRLVESQDGWYLIAYCHIRKDLRTFAMHRIGDYRIRDEHFVPIFENTVDDWLKSAFQIEHRHEEQKVSIYFAPGAARYIRERLWHPTQVIKELEDGSCVIEFVSPSMDEVQRWVLQYGNEARVLEPSSLADQMEQILGRALKLYQDSNLRPVAARGVEQPKVGKFSRRRKKS